MRRPQIRNDLFIMLCFDALKTNCYYIEKSMIFAREYAAEKRFEFLEGRVKKYVRKRRACACLVHFAD